MKFAYLKLENLKDVLSPSLETARKNVGLCRAYREGVKEFYENSVETLRDLMRERIAGYSFWKLGKNGEIKKVKGKEVIPGKYYTINPRKKDKRIAAELVAIGDMAVEKIGNNKDYASLALEAYALSGNLFVTKNTANKFLGAIQDDNMVGEEVMALARLEKNGHRHCEKKMDKIKEILGEEAFYKSIIKIGEDPLTLTLPFAVRNWSD